MWAPIGKVAACGSESWVLEVAAAGPHGLVCANSSRQRQVTLHDAATLQCSWSSSPHAPAAVTDVSARPDLLLVSGGSDGTVALLDPRTPGPPVLLHCGGAGGGPVVGVSSCAHLVAASAGDALWLLDTRSRRALARLDCGHAGDVGPVRWGPDALLATGGAEDGLVALWRGASGWGEDALEEVWNEDVPVARLDWVGDTLLVSSLQQASLWRAGERLWTVPTADAYAPCGFALARVAMAHRDGAVALIPPPTVPQHQVWLMGGHTAACRGVAQIADTVFSGGEDGVLCAWKERQQQEFLDDAPTGPVRSKLEFQGRKA